MGFLTTTRTQTSLFKFSGPDVLQVIEESCLVVGILPNEDTLYNHLEQLIGIFQEEPNVTIGTIDADNFVWPSGEKLKFKESRNSLRSTVKQVLVFDKKNVDRTCLLKPAHSVRYPVAEYFTGPYTLEGFVSYINSKCGTLRTSTGHVSPAGYHRQDILQNVFHVVSVSDTNMGRLYSLPHNSLNSSYCWDSDSLSESESCNPSENVKKETCFKSVNMKNGYLYDEPKEHVKMAECERIKGPLTKDEFFNLYLKRSHPVIIEDIVSQWPAFNKWTNEFLRETGRDNDVHIKLTPGGDYEGVESVEMWENYQSFQIPADVKKHLPYPDLVVVRPAAMNMKYSEFMDFINRTAQSTERKVSAYLEYSSLSDTLPGLEEDIKEPEFAAKILNLKHVNVWHSDGHTLGRLHFDPYDNLLCQV